MFNRHECRLKLVFALFKSLLLDRNIKQVFINDNEYDIEKGYFNEDKDYIDKVLDDLENNTNNYIDLIKPLLVHWDIDRINYLDKAIMIEAISEIKTGLNNKKIAINEAIIISKEYIPDDNYKYINGVLDKI